MHKWLPCPLYQFQLCVTFKNTFWKTELSGIQACPPLLRLVHFRPVCPNSSTVGKTHSEISTMFLVLSKPACSENLGVRIHKVKHTHCLKALSNHKTKWVVSRRCIYTHTDSNKPSQAHPIAVMLKHTHTLTHSLTQRAKRKEINKTPSICFWMHQLSQASFNLVI